MNQQINLYAALPRTQAPALSFYRMVLSVLVVLIILVISGIALSWNVGLHNKEIATLRERATNLTTQAAYYKKMGKVDFNRDVEQLNSQIQAKQQLVDLINEGRVNGEGFTKILTAISNAIPSTVWLQQINIQAAGAEIQLVGKSEQSQAVAKFSRALAQDPTFKGLLIRTSQLDTGTQSDETTGLLWNFTLEAKRE